MSSEERARWKLFEKTREAGNDDALVRLLGGYYIGEINAKQLKAAMKLHKEHPELNAAMIEELCRNSSAR